MARRRVPKQRVAKMTSEKEATTAMTELLTEANWFAIQAKPHREDLAAASLDALDLEVFLPKVKPEQMVCGFARFVTKPLFPGYFFARFCPFLSYDVVRYAYGVLRVVGTRRFPIPLDAEVVLAIKARVQDDGFIHLQRKRFLPGEKVAVEKGPFAGWMGKVEREW